MNERERKKAELKKKAEEARNRTDELLADELQALRNATRLDLEKLRPRVTDEETYNKLIDIVEQSTQQNEDLAQIKTRLENLGETGIRMGKSVAKLLMGI